MDKLLVNWPLTGLDPLLSVCVCLFVCVFSDLIWLSFSVCALYRITFLLQQCRKFIDNFFTLELDNLIQLLSLNKLQLRILSGATFFCHVMILERVLYIDGSDGVLRMDAPSFSCSYRQISCQLIFFGPKPRGWHLFWEILDTLLRPFNLLPPPSLHTS